MSKKETDPRKEQNIWAAEMQAATKRLKPWRKKAEKINKRFLAERTGNSTESLGGDTRLNLFYSNVSTLQSMLYGSVPKIDVSRRYADSSDDTARVAAETMERLLNADVAENGHEYDTVLRSTLQDRLLGGLGCAKIRYQLKTKIDPETGEEEMISEAAPADYFYWGDILWGWGRSFSDLPWIAFRNYMSRGEVTDRFGEEVAEDLDFKQRSVSVTNETSNAESNSDTKKAEVWEIWDKKSRHVYWYAKGQEKILDHGKSMLELRDFFPCPPFFIANPTTSLYIPTPDFQMSQDLYNEVDILQTRITILTQAVKAAGVYDAGCDGVERLFKEGTDNTLIPVDSWAAFSEKGGLQGAVQWLPLADIVGALDKLTSVRDQTITLLQQVSGFSDIMRGSLDNQHEGVGQSAMKAKFGSVRVQALQDQFAQFATDLMQLKAEVIARHFSPETIARQSNMGKSLDADMLPEAIDLIKRPDEARLAVAIRPESVAMVDYAQLKSERVDFLNAISTFLQSSAPLMQSKPETEPFLLQMLQWSLSGFKGAQEIEGVMDKAIEGAIQEIKNKAANPQPDPEEAKAQKLAEMDAQKEQAKLQGEMQKIQAKAQADMQTREQDKMADIETAQMQHQLDMQKIQAESQADLQEIQAKAEMQKSEQQHDAQMNAMQNEAVTQQEIQKVATSAQIDLEKMAAKAEMDIEVDKQKKLGDADE